MAEPLEEHLLEWIPKREIVNDDLEEISGIKPFMKHYAAENKRLWLIAGPAIFATLARYSLGATTIVFVGRYLSTVELGAVSTENMVVAGLAFGIMMGMGSALETLCGQAYGAKQYDMLGVYLQRSWIILLTVCVCLLPIYIFAAPILKFFRQDEEIADVAGRFALYMIPQLFAYGINFPVSKFLQSQSKVFIMAVIAAVALLVHVFLSWLLIVQLNLGLAGAAVSLNFAWWMIVIGQFGYIVLGYCPGAWNGFTWGAFSGLKEFAMLSLGSGIMLCLEFWYYTILIVLVGNLPNAQLAVASVAICINLSGWEMMVFFGFNVAISVRVSNELGAKRPRAAKFAILVVISTSLVLGLFFFTLILCLKNVYGIPFTNNPQVVKAVADFAIVFAFTLLLNSIQPVLTGVAIGAGWQWLVAYINFTCYYIIGIPVGCVLSFYFNLNVKGMWSGMLTGVVIQTIILICITSFTNWNKEVSMAASRIKKWGGISNEHS